MHGPWGRTSFRAIALPLVIGAAFVAGASFAGAAAGPVGRATHPASTRYFASTALFAGGAVAPGAGVWYGLYPDWALMYLANPAHLTGWIMLPLVVLLAGAAPLAGFLAAHRFVGRKSFSRALVAAAIALGVLAVLGWGRLGMIGHYEAYHYGGELVPLFGSEAVLPILLVSAAIAAAYVAVRREVQRHVRALA